MTLVYFRDRPSPATHAFVVGCGRFPGLAADHHLDRPQTVEGARELVRFLLSREGDLVAPLASIECLLSDPACAAGADILGVGQFANDPRPNDSVDAANSTSFDVAGSAWLARCQPGDQLFFYMSSHGAVERDATALALLEDVGTNPNRPWSQSVNVSNLAAALPKTGAGACWVFLDACQEDITDLAKQIGGAQGVTIITYNLQDLANAKIRSIGLAGSRFGGKAWAPTDGKAPFFTQALIEGMSGACVEAMDTLGWVVSGRQLFYGLTDVADAAFDYPALETEPIAMFNKPAALVKVADPKVPIAVRTAIESHLGAATKVFADDGAGTRYDRADNELTWRFRVFPDGRKYSATAEFPPGGPSYQPKQFAALAPAQIVVLTS